MSPLTLFAASMILHTKYVTFEYFIFRVALGVDTFWGDNLPPARTTEPQWVWYREAFQRYADVVRVRCVFPVRRVYS